MKKFLNPTRIKYETGIFVFFAVAVLLFVGYGIINVEATRSDGNPLLETNSNSVCGNVLCDIRMTSEEKIYNYYFGTVDSETVVQQAVNMGIPIQSHPSSMRILTIPQLNKNMMIKSPIDFIVKSLQSKGKLLSHVGVSNKELLVKSLNQELNKIKITDKAIKSKVFSKINTKQNIEKPILDIKIKSIQSGISQEKIKPNESEKLSIKITKETKLDIPKIKIKSSVSRN